MISAVLFGLIILVLGWVFDIGSLYLAISAKQKDDKKMAKFYCVTMTVGEWITKISLLYISVVLAIMLMSKF